MKYLDSFKIYEAIRIQKLRLTAFTITVLVVKDKEVFRVLVSATLIGMLYGSQIMKRLLKSFQITHSEMKKMST